MEQQMLLQQIEQVRTGDETALAAIIALQMPAIRSIAAKLVCPGLDFDDAVQEGIIALFHAIKTFDDTKQAQFRTYANVCVQNAITDAARNASRLKHAPLNQALPIPTEESTQSPEETIVADEAFSHTVRSIHTRLSVFEKQVLQHFLSGESYAQIALALQKSEKSIDNALQRVRAKLK